FVDAFLDKHPMRGLLERVPVRVILERHPALLGAAVAARELSQPAAERRVVPPA
ncbi:MAG: glucokinase, partial [Acidobacteria bacterium]|nr:glucokinase [Acidobacteriota bacterium]